MAAVAVHSAPIPPHSPYRKTSSRPRLAYQAVPPVAPQPPPAQVHASQIQPSTKPDPFYGHEYIARLCARFITHLFACPEYPPSSTHSQAKLPYFIAYALHRTKLHQSVTFAALVLLQRLKARFPTARGSSGHRLFISAFMIASKVICDDTYSNKSWSIVAQGMFTLREINQMEREMCGYLDWELTVDNVILANFENMVKKDFRGPGPYPTYSLHMVSKKPIASSAHGGVPPVGTSISPIPSFGQRNPTPPAPPSSASTITTVSSVPRSVTSHHIPAHIPPLRSSSTASTVSTSSSYSSPPATPETPSSCSSTSTSPASTASPRTPGGPVDEIAQIFNGPSGQALSHLGPEKGSITASLAIRKEKAPSVHPLKGKMFAYAIPSVW